MPKSCKITFDSKLTFINLLNAHNRAKKNKQNKKEIILFEMDLESNLTNLLNRLKNGTYKCGKYRMFTVYEPKERIIKSLPYVDRIVHQWYVEAFIKPYFVKRFINDSYACIENKGTHKAVNKLKNYIKEDYKYVIKFDIKKYFYNIDKDILYNILSKKFTCPKLKKFSFDLIYSDEGNGIPIGNYTSQYFANIYLNELDYYVKQNLKIKHYIRYMDDFIVFTNEYKIIFNKIDIFLKTKLNLELNKKSCYFPKTKGIGFCGYVSYINFRLLRKSFKRKVNKKLKLWIKLYNTDLKKYEMVISSFQTHCSHCNSFRYKTKIYSLLETLK